MERQSESRVNIGESKVKCGRLWDVGTSFYHKERITLLYGAEGGPGDAGKCLFSNKCMFKVYSDWKKDHLFPISQCFAIWNRRRSWRIW